MHYSNLWRILALAAAALLLVAVQEAGAQESAAGKGSISTNVAGYANLLTLNAEGSVPVSRRWTVNAGLKYNPFAFGKEKFRNKQQAYYAGMRYWPWHSYSGWWMSGKIQYQEFNAGGLGRAETSEGDRVGLGLGAGFAYMVGKHFNVLQPTPAPSAVTWNSRDGRFSSFPAT